MDDYRPCSLMLTLWCRGKIPDTRGSTLMKIKFTPNDSKKVKIFEIGLLEVYEGGGGVGCPGSTLNCVLTYMYICSIMRK